MKVRTVIWEKLDTLGLDSCRVVENPEGWKIEGTAVFSQGGKVTSLSYDIICDTDWSSRAAFVRGWIGSRNIHINLTRTPASGWTSNGQQLVHMQGFLDIDLGFTPASNTNVIHRLDLQIGQGVETTAIWLDPTDWTIKPLMQFYRKLSSNNYHYASPIHDYEAELEVDNFGMVINYPNLWKAMSAD